MQIGVGASQKIVVIVSIVALIIVGAFIYLSYVQRPALRPAKPIVGVLRIYGYLLSEEERDLYLKAITYAIRNDSIKGVIVVIDSPGGYASIAEDLYYSLQNLDRKKPVIALVQGLAASGGYFASLGARYIISEPTSFVGNIGVIAIAPPIIIPSEMELDTGPYKYSGFSVKEFPYVVRHAFNTFLSAVNESRGDRLHISLKELSLGKLYLGSEALKLGLIDEVGSFTSALDRILEFTKLRYYTIVDLLEVITNGSSMKTPGYLLWKNMTLLSIKKLRSYHNVPLSLYYISPYYLANFTKGEMFSQFYYVPYPPATTTMKRYIPLSNVVLVDRTHGNAFNPALFGELFGEIVKHGCQVLLVEGGMNLTELLSRKPKSLIIFTPTIKYSQDEIIAIKNYVREGGRLVLIYDTSMAFAESINSLSEVFGMYFSDGYLYNAEDNYGIYRNIFVERFGNSTLVTNISRIVLFTATHIYTNGTPLALVDATLSITESRGIYVPIAVNNDVLAIGDSTFLMDPFCHIEDNWKFLENLVNFLLKEK